MPPLKQTKELARWLAKWGQKGKQAAQKRYVIWEGMRSDRWYTAADLEGQFNRWEIAGLIKGCDAFEKRTTSQRHEYKRIELEVET